MKTGYWIVVALLLTAWGLTGCAMLHPGTSQALDTRNIVRELEKQNAIINRIAVACEKINEEQRKHRLGY